MDVGTAGEGGHKVASFPSKFGCNVDAVRVQYFNTEKSA